MLKIRNVQNFGMFHLVSCLCEMASNDESDLRDRTLVDEEENDSDGELIDRTMLDPEFSDQFDSDNNSDEEADLTN